jgi:hypothetical protein
MPDVRSSGDHTTVLPATEAQSKDPIPISHNDKCPASIETAAS